MIASVSFVLTGNLFCNFPHAGEISNFWRHNVKRDILNMSCDCWFPCCSVYWSLVKAWKIVWESHIIDSSSITQSDALLIWRCDVTTTNSIQYGGALVVNIFVFEFRVQLQHCTYQRKTLPFALIEVITFICKKFPFKSIVHTHLYVSVFNQILVVAAIEDMDFIKWHVIFKSLCRNPSGFTDRFFDFALGEKCCDFLAHSWYLFKYFLNISTLTSSCDDEHLNCIIFCICSNSSFYCLPVTIVKRLPLWCGVCQDLCNIALHLNSKVSIWSQVTSSAIILYTPVRILFKLFLLLIIAVFRLLNWS